jgi:hypothetical protein
MRVPCLFSRFLFTFYLRRHKSQDDIGADKSPNHRLVPPAPRPRPRPLRHLLLHLVPFSCPTALVLVMMFVIH